MTLSLIQFKGTYFKFPVIHTIFFNKKIREREREKSYGCVYSTIFSSYLNSVARNQIRKYATGARSDGAGNTTIRLHPAALIGRHSNFLVCHVKFL